MAKIITIVTTRTTQIKAITLPRESERREREKLSPQCKTKSAMNKQEQNIANKINNRSENESQ